jgi:hypothetical protein
MELIVIQMMEQLVKQEIVLWALLAIHRLHLVVLGVPME